MATTLEQHVALDETLVPNAQRLRIGQSNFRLPPDIQSKEPTLQVVYDVLQEILEFLRFLGHSTQIKTLTDVNVNKLYQPWRSFATVINKCLTGKSSGIDSLRLSQAQILWGLYHRSNVDYAYLIWEDFVYQVEHKNQKKSNEMYYPRFTKVIIDYFMTRKPSIPRQNRVNWHYVRDDVLFSTIKVVSRHQTTQQYGVILPIELTTDDIRNNKAYKEYYACATGEVAPKPKASTRKKKGGSASSTTSPTPVATPTPTTTVVSAPRLSAAAKGKQPARSTNPIEPTDDKAEKVNDDDDNEEEVPKIDEQETTESDEGDNEATKSDRESEDEEIREQEEESFDPIPQTPEESEDDDNNEEDQGLRIGEEERMQEEDEADELYRDVDINQGQGLQVSQETEDSHVILTPTQSDAQQESSSTSSFMTNLLNPLIDPADLSEMELKKILIDKMEGNKSDRGSKRRREGGEHASASTPSELATGSPSKPPTPDHDWNKSVPAAQGNAQSWISALAKQTDARSLFNKLLDTPIDFSNFIMNQLGVDTLTLELLAGPTYELMRGSYRWSKRRREGGEHASASTPSEPATGKEPVQTTCQMEEPSHLVIETGVEDQPIIQTTQHPEWFSQSRRPPTPDRDWNKFVPAAQGNTQSWISALAKQIDARSSFNELLDTPIDLSNFIMNRLGVDTLTPELLAGPTYELMRGHVIA
nr:hypothetical protein [Tanacetum cinerariifolium]